MFKKLFSWLIAFLIAFSPILVEAKSYKSIHHHGKDSLHSRKTVYKSYGSSHHAFSHKGNAYASKKSILPPKSTYKIGNTKYTGWFRNPFIRIFLIAITWMDWNSTPTMRPYSRFTTWSVLARSMNFTQQGSSLPRRMPCSVLFGPTPTFRRRMISSLSWAKRLKIRWGWSYNLEVNKRPV